MYSDDDRLKTPLIRKEINGEQVFQEATWEQALDLIASRFKEISDANGPESIALLKHGTPGKHLEHLFRAMGSNTIAEPAYAQCRGPRETGFGATFGNGLLDLPANKRFFVGGGGIEDRHLGALGLKQGVAALFGNVLFSAFESEAERVDHECVGLA